MAIIANLSAAVASLTLSKQRPEWRDNWEANKANEKTRWT